MIIRVWGVVNSTEVEFTPIPDRPGYWEGYAPKAPGLQDIEIWAESDSGLRGHLRCEVQILYHTHTVARLVLLPYIVSLVTLHTAELLPEKYIPQFKCCRKAAK